MIETDSQKNICIIAGGGSLPLTLLNSIKQQNHKPFIITLDGHADIEITDIPNIKIKIGQLGKAISFLKDNNIKHLCFAGRIKRPSISELKLDMLGVKFLAKLGIKKLSGGDDFLLKQVASFFESHELEILGPNEICRDITISKGHAGKIKPSDKDLLDIKYGEEILSTLSKFDIGQSVIVENKYVLGVEAAEGTDELIKRIKDYKKEKNYGVLVKKPKINQHLKIDLPTIGIETLDNIINSNLKGIAINADNTLVLDKEKLIEKADKHKIFIVGI